MTAATRPHNPAYRYFVRAGEWPEQGAWVVVDNWTGEVVEQFGARGQENSTNRLARAEAREYVKDANHVG